jgi:hypothetical protein
MSATAAWTRLSITCHSRASTWVAFGLGCGWLLGISRKDEELIQGSATADETLTRLFRPSASAVRTLCQSETPQTASSFPSTSVSILSFRKILFNLHLWSLPVPRLVQPHDPDLVLSPRRIRQRNRDEAQVRQLQERILQAIQARDQDKLADLLRQTYTVLYGAPTSTANTNSPKQSCYSPQDRQDFLQQYGCTGWTEEILLVLCELARDRGIVEIGAGQGQWARTITERYNSLLASSESHSMTNKKTQKHFDVVLAYDDYSALPLNPEIYHKKTKAHQQYFFNSVQDCRNTPLSTILSSWTCRGRVLLLVYPHNNDMAVDALQAYINADPLRNDTLVYVGEGRGGVNANDKFFDALESGDWILERTMPVQVFGTKGYEQLYILRRQRRQQQR